MGGVVQFHRALGRRPLPKWPKFAGASGPHQGLTFDQWAKTGNPLPWEVVVLCADSDNPAVTLRELQTTTDVHGCFDLIDIAEVKHSWGHAAQLNVELRRGQ